MCEGCSCCTGPGCRGSCGDAVMTRSCHGKGPVSRRHRRGCALRCQAQEGWANALFSLSLKELSRNPLMPSLKKQQKNPIVSVLKMVLKRRRQQDDNEMMGYEPEGGRWYWCSAVIPHGLHSFNHEQVSRVKGENCLEPSTLVGGGGATALPGKRDTGSPERFLNSPRTDLIFYQPK